MGHLPFVMAAERPCLGYRKARAGPDTRAGRGRIPYDPVVRSALVTAFGLATSLAYAAAIVWLYSTQPRTLQEVRAGARVAAGVYAVDEARFRTALELFRREQYAAARDEWQRADPAGRDARVAFYVAYSCYRQGWGRFHHDDRLYAEGLAAADRALALSGGNLRVDDPELGLQTALDLRAELQRGVEKTWSDLNPLRVMEKRK
jgi:hypothetical protein